MKDGKEDDPMMAEEAQRLGIDLEVPAGDRCPSCLSETYACGTQQSARSFHGKVIFRSSRCMARGESIVLDRIRQWRESEAYENA